ncbi:DUF6463 family protein [Streptomyces sp. JJ38]|uniref:DUF6463 family protein n=1 Tax=Streptomyces sp. JJ38 TaxID=2738128 RepID=UPI00214B6F6A|nr:DUF6463 family protein [Streptomyces sp. JJ38]
MTLWAGRSLIVLSLAHLLGMGVQTTEHLDDWLSGALWGLSRDEFVEPSRAAGAFWLVIASFAVPMLLLGMLVCHLSRQGLVVPAPIGWGLGAWCLIGAAILEPSPLLLGLVPAVLLVRDARGQGTASPADGCRAGGAREGAAPGPVPR